MEEKNNTIRKKKDDVKTLPKKENTSEWYQEVMLRAELADYTAVSGCIVYRPRSYEMWEMLRCAVDKEIKKLGVKNAYFPLFIPEKLLSKEADHVEGFTPEVAWVTETGDSKLNERLAVRPTSEAIMYDSYSKWIRSWRDLPLKLNQWNNVVRWEFKHAVPFLRGREFLWNEGHTVFATKEEAIAETHDIIEMYEKVMKDVMALPCLIGYKSEKEKFAGAEYTMSTECLLPNGKAIQGPDAHFDGQNFAKAYDIKFLDKDEKEKYAWQNTWAITTRMLGVMFLMHGDDKGLVNPPWIAPEQIVITPILFEKNPEILEKAKEVKEILNDFRVVLDDRDYVRPGSKYYEWELKGVPLRIEIGPRDLGVGNVVLVRRDNGEKIPVKISEVKEKAEEVLKDIHKSLYEKAYDNLHKNIVKADTWDELVKAIENKKIVLARSCGNPECEDNIKDKSSGVKTLNRPLQQPQLDGKCVACGKEAKYWMYFGKSY